SLTTFAVGEDLLVQAIVRDISERKYAEMRLRDSEERLRSILDHAPIPVATNSLDPNPRITYLNRQYREIIGYTLDDIPTVADWARLAYPDAAYREQVFAQWNADMQRAEGVTGSTGSHEVRVVCKDGAVREMLIRATVSQDMAVVTLIDITPIKETEQRLRAITDVAHDAILMINPSGAITYWNPAAEQILGYRADEALGRNLHGLLAPERFHAAHEAAFRIFQRTGQGAAINRTLELAALHKSGREIIIELSLAAVHLTDGWNAIGILRDITERKEMAAALERNKAILDRAQAVAHVGSWYLDIPNDTLEWSDETCRILGMAPGVPGRIDDFRACIHPEDREWVTAAWRKALRSGPYDVVHRIVDDGAIRWVRARAEFQLAADGTPASALGTVHDITELQQTRLDLERQKGLLRTVLDYSPSGLALFDENRHLLLHNPQYERLLRLPDGLLHRPDLDYEAVLRHRWERGDFPESNWDSLRDRVFRSLDSRKHVVLTRKSYDDTILETHAIPLPDGGILICHIDITELTQARVELERLNRDLETRTREAEAA
ncbi:MAG: PAS domain S-box protein, partial [Gammaproteobacteria bacterium]|nr:PAS domain S-box protein [Gammaproteobacteria bacterium]